MKNTAAQPYLTPARPKNARKVQLSENAYQVFKRRYLRHGDNGNPVESVEDTFWRVAYHIAKEEEKWGKDSLETAARFYDLLASKRFLPNSPTFTGAGTPLGQLAACFVLPLTDDMGRREDGIFQTLRNAALIQQTGGGNGFSFSQLRPQGDVIKTSAGHATGPVGFLHVYDQAFGEIAQGGSRRGANMAVLRVDHPDIEEFITCKTNESAITNFNISVGVTDAFMEAVENDDWWELRFPDVKDPAYRGFHGTLEEAEKAGIPIIVYETIRARELFNIIVEQAHHNGEPGVLFLDTANRGNPVPHLYTLQATNPCVTGETLVAVADGRGHVPIAQLADEGNDVPVFTRTDTGAVTVRTMRNPRITGYGKAVFLITLDDGSTIKTTGNHKFLVRGEEYKQVQDLEPGDSLLLMSRYKASIKDIFGEVNSNSQDYMWVAHGQRGVEVEHRLIAEFHYNTKLQTGLVVHHKDYDALNNSPSNLKIMSKEAHDRLHAQDMMGDKNPMRRAETEWSDEKWATYKAKHSKNNRGSGNANYSGATNDELREHAIILVTKLQRPFSVKEWAEYAKSASIPQQFSKWRNDHLGGIPALSRWAAREVGVIDFDIDPRSLRFYQEMAQQGYDVDVVDGNVVVHKNCEVCGKPITVPGKRREIAMCSISCSNKKAWKQNPHRGSAISASAKERHVRTRTLQAGIYNDLRFDLGREPLQKEWKTACEAKDVSPEIGRSSSPFTSLDDLHEYANNVNHKVVSVEYIGEETVYNGTVDEFHNFFVGGWKAKTANGKDTWHYANNLQCGEQFLGPYENCCLGSVNLAQHATEGGGVDWEKLQESVALATYFLDDVVDANAYVPAVPALKEAAHRARRIGLGIMGLGDLMYRVGVGYGSEAGQEFASQVMEFVRYHAMRTSIELAEARGPFPAIQGSVYDPQAFAKGTPSATWQPPTPITPYQHAWERPDVDWDTIVQGITAHGIRNAAQTTIAPTGTTGTVSGCEGYGCEPVFALAYTRHVEDNGEDLQLTYTSPLFETALAEAGLEEETRLDIVEQVLEKGTCQGIESLPEHIREIFIVAQDITAEEHVRTQAALQAFVDNSISKTVNFPAGAKVTEVAEAYKLAWELGCKGLTVYVTGSREKVVLETNHTTNAAGTPPTQKNEVEGEQLRIWNEAKKARPQRLIGYTYKIETPLGKTFVTINENGNDQPFEVFVNTSKAGSDTAAVSEAIGRSLSYILRLSSPIAPRERLMEIVRQLTGIGGRRPLGFGSKRVHSLPDGVAQALQEYLDNTADTPISAAKIINDNGQPAFSEKQAGLKIGDLCPDCGQATLINEEGCRKCYSCGYSEC